MIGLTGGIGTGKSTVSRMLAALGAVIVDSDEIVRQVQSPGSPVLGEIRSAFGDGVIAEDGSLDRAALGDIVFRDDEARKRLNAIVHPAVGRESARQLRAARERGEPLIVLGGTTRGIADSDRRETRPGRPRDRQQRNARRDRGAGASAVCGAHRLGGPLSVRPNLHAAAA